MYHKASISPLSSTQISKVLNGHSVRVKLGAHQTIHLSKEQFKNFNRAKAKGQAVTITLIHTNECMAGIYGVILEMLSIQIMKQKKNLVTKNMRVKFYLFIL